MGYNINLGCWSSVFAVPCAIVDEHLRLAGESSVKALLYILRNAEKTPSEQDISDSIGIPAEEIKDAVEYWVDCGVLQINDNILSPAPAKAVQAEPISDNSSEPLPDDPAQALPDDDNRQTDTAKPEANEHNTKPAPAKRHERIRYSYQECVSMMSDDADLRQMLIILEGLMQKQLNHTEISVFITLVRYYGLPSRCVAMLVEYCHSIGKSSIAYIESTGMGWAGEEINTIERANAKISRLRQLYSAWNKVRFALDIPERKPSNREEEFCDIWINKQNYPIELIKLAYDRCIDKKGRLMMGYINGILEKWHNNGILTAEQALEESKPPQSETSGENGRFEPTYDKSEIDDIMFSDLLSDN